MPCNPHSHFLGDSCVSHEACGGVAQAVDFKWAVGQARDGKIAVLCFHGVPALDHPWVNCKPEDFKKYMRYLKDLGCTVIAMRDLAKYVDPKKRPKDRYQPIRDRVGKKGKGK